MEVSQIRGMVDAALSAAKTYATQATTPYEKLRKTLEAIRAALDELEREPTSQGGMPPEEMRDVRAIPLRSAPPDTPESAAGFATWPGHGYAKPGCASVQGMPLGVWKSDGRAHRKRAKAPHATGKR
jgi:hypothetical protein